MLAFLAWQIYNLEPTDKKLEDQLNKMGPKLDSAISSLTNAKNSIDSLNTKIKNYEGNLGKLVDERDSLLLIFKKETAENWASVEAVLKQQRKNYDELNLLKKRNKEFK